MLKSITLFVTLLLLVLLSILGCDDPVESEEVHFEAIGLFIISGEDTLATYQDLIVTGSLDVTELDTTDLLMIKFIDEDGDIGVPPSNDWQLDWDIDDRSVADVIESETDRSLYKVRIYGKVTGQTNIRIVINHLGHKDYESADIPIIVTSRN